MTPKLHQSTELVYPVPRMISGAKYAGVPTKVKVRAAIRQHPKSTNLVLPLKSSSTFSGFKSR